MLTSIDQWLGYDTGMHWCESRTGNNYKIMPFVAEFANTVSSLPLLVLPLINLVQLRPYILRHNRAALLPHVMLMLTGLASTYYHATLSLFGQLLDVLTILHVLNSCMIVYLPVLTDALPKQLLHTKLQSIRLTLILLSLVCSNLCFLKPSMNAFALALMIFSLPGAIIVYFEATRNGMPEVAQFAPRVFGAWILASGCWLADRLICDLWLQLGTPYFHAFWHCFSAYAAYIVLCGASVLDIRQRALLGQHRFRVHVRFLPSADDGTGKKSSSSPSLLSCLPFPYLCLEDQEEGGRCAE